MPPHFLKSAHTHSLLGDVQEALSKLREKENFIHLSSDDVKIKCIWHLNADDSLN